MSDGAVRRVARAAAGALVAIPVLTPEPLGLDARIPAPMLVPFRRVLAAGALALAGAVAAVDPLRRDPAAGVATVAVAALLASAAVVEGHGRRVTAEPAGRPLRILAFNVLQGRADVAALERAVRDERPDVVVLPEAGDRFRNRVHGCVADLGYRSWSSRAGAILPRRIAAHPDGPCVSVLVAEHLGDVTVETVEPGTLFGWLAIRGGALGSTRVLAVHPAAPHPQRVGHWRREIALLGPWLAAGDTVVVGDLNATLEHRALRRALGTATSVGAASGAARTATWPTSWPRWLGVAIDHVVVTPGIGCRGYRVLDLPGSDHRAVVADLVLRG